MAAGPVASTYILIRGDSSQVMSELKKLEGAAAISGTKVEKSLGSRLQRAGSRMSSVGTKMSRNITLPIIAAGAASVKLAMDFEKTMKTMEAVAGVTGQPLERLKDLAIDLGKETVFSAREAGEAMLALAKAGISPAEIEAGALKHTLDLATAGELQLADAASVAATAMNTFGLSGEQTQIAVDALAGAANASDADVSDMAMALKMGGNAAATAGLDIQETAAALAALADEGIKGSDAGTSLKTMLLNLVPATERAKRKMEELDLSFVDGQGNIDDLEVVAGKLQDRLGGLSQAQRISALRTIFGTDAFRAANIILAEGEKGMRRYIDATSEQGTAARVGEKRMSGFAGKVEELKGSLETAGIAVGEALIPMLTKLADKVTDVANDFSELDDSTQRNILLTAGGAALLGPIIRLAGSLSTALGWASKHMVGLGKAGANAGGALFLLQQAMQAVEDFQRKGALEAIVEQFEDIGKLGGPATAPFAGFISNMDDTLSRTGVVADSFMPKINALNKAVGEGAGGAFDEAGRGAIAYQKVLKNAGKSTDRAREDISFFATMSAEELKKWHASAIENISGVAQEFIDMGADGKLSFDELREGMNEQLKAVLDFKKNVRTLIRKGASEDFITSLINMGDEGKQWAAVLADQNRKTIGEFEGTRERVHRVAGNLVNDLARVEGKTKNVRTQVTGLNSDLNDLSGKVVTITYQGRTTGVHVGGPGGGGTIPVGVTAATGFDGIIRRPTTFMVGEHFRPERVSVTPLQGPNLHGPRSGPTVNNVYNIDARGASPGVGDEIVRVLDGHSRMNARRTSVRS